MSGVSLRHVVKRYGSVVAVDDVTFDVPDGKIVGILGPSGCGKTSTLRMIAGLEGIDGGEVQIGDKVVNNLEPAQRNVAMAFENYGLYPHWTCYENVAYPLRLRSLPAAEVQLRVLEVAGRLKIGDVLALRPGGLSGGVQQRVGLARALVRDPEVFLLDEPMSHVDPDLRGELRQELKRLQRELGATMIYVTHDQLEAMSLSDIVIVMNAAKIQQIGSPSEVFNDPANVFVAGFLGEPPANFFPCDVQAADGDLRLVLDGRHSISVPPRYRQALEQRRTTRVTLAVRPHHIGVSHTAMPGWMDAIVYVVEALGDRTVVSLRVGETVAKAEVAPDFTAGIDERVSIAFDPKHSILFNEADGSAV